MLKKSYFLLGLILTLMFGTVYFGYKGFQRELSPGHIGSDVRGLQEQSNNEGNRESKNNSVVLSNQDLDLLARVVHGEARGEPYEGQVAVAEVILNRVESPDFPKTVSGVIFQEGAFDAVADGQIWLEPSRTSVRAAIEAAEGTYHTEGALYYFNPAKSSNKWIWTRPQTRKIGDHIFAK